MLHEKKWYRLNETNASRLPDSPGSYELSGTGAIVLFIGWAGEAGLRARILRHIKDPDNPCIARNAFFFRFELSPSPDARAAELLESFRAERYGILPECMQP
jgi:hypothetical protein